MSYIQFNGKKSSDFFMKLQAEVTFTSPARNLTEIKVDGQDGNILLGDGSLNNTSLSLPFIVNVPTGKTVLGVASEISNWLKQDGKWHDLIFSEDASYIYKDCYYEETDVSQMISWFGKCILKFRIKPYKFLKTGQTEIQLLDSITNPSLRESRPKIIIKGTGNATLTIGSEILTLKNVDGGLIVDTLYNTAISLDGSRPAWDKIVSYPLPVIKPGVNIITKSDTITDVRIVPRWEVIV